MLNWNVHSFQLLEIIQVLDSIYWVRCASGNVYVFVQEKGGEKLGLGTEEEGGRWMGRNRGGGDEIGEMRRRMG